MSLTSLPFGRMARVLVPIDGTFASWVALDWCLQQLDASWELLLVASCADVLASVAALGLADAGAVLAAMESARRSALEAWLDVVRASGRRCRGVLTAQPIAVAVERLAADESVDLLVMSTCRSQRRHDRQHASMVRALDREPPCPMLVLPACRPRRGADVRPVGDRRRRGWVRTRS